MSKKISVTAMISEEVAELTTRLYEECVRNGSYQGSLEEYYGTYISNELNTIIKMSGLK